MCDGASFFTNGEQSHPSQVSDNGDRNLGIENTIYTFYASRVKHLLLWSYIKVWHIGFWLHGKSWQTDGESLTPQVKWARSYAY